MTTTLSQRLYSLIISIAGCAGLAVPAWGAVSSVDAFPGLSFSAPVCMASPPGDTHRLFVCTKGGTLFVIPDVSANTPQATAVLKLTANPGGLFHGRTPAETLSADGEQGLLGLAFHPDYATNGFIYIFYSVTRDGNVYERVSRLRLKNRSTAKPTASLDSELILIEQLDQAGNHNGGDLHFGPDGYLYVSLGDEGGQNDQFFNSQRIDKDFFSGILRIDVNLEGSEIAGGNPGDPDDANLLPHAHAAIPLHGGKPGFEIPAGNPFVGATTFNGSAVNTAKVRTEFWAVGLRNPWRFSFDGKILWCGDVGGGQREEVNMIQRARNYGWVYREGSIAGPFGDSSPPHATPPADFHSKRPLYEYVHGSGTYQGNSVTGGIVYRGSLIPSLQGKYIFADFISGNVWSLTRRATDPPVVKRILSGLGIVAFAPDPSNGDVLMANLKNSRILRIVPAVFAPPQPAR